MRWSRWLIIILAVVVAAGLVVLALQRHDQPVASAVNQGAQGPVLLVSGYGGGAQGMATIAAALKKQGRTAVIVPAVGDNTGDIEVQAKHLNEVVRQQLADGATSVDVVGHSQGGVVARVWANEYGANVARRIVTLGSPHHGTDVAEGLARGNPSQCPTACEQLVPGSSLLKELPETPAGARWVSIFTAVDDTVIPVRTSILKGAVNIETQLVCADSKVSHTELITDPLTIGLIELALDGPPLTAPPGPSQCATLRADG